MKCFLFFFFSLPLVFAQTPRMDGEAVRLQLEKRRTKLNEVMAAGDYKTQIRLAKEGLAYCPPDCTRARAMFHLFSGVGHEFLKAFPEAEKEYLSCLSLAVPLGKADYTMTALSRLQYVYNYTKQNAKRLDIIRQMEVYGDSLKSLDIQELATLARAAYYEDRSEYEKAVDYRLKLIDLNKKQIAQEPDDESHKTNTGYQLNNLANIFSLMGRHEKALEYLAEGSTYLKGKALKNGEETQYIFYIQAYLGLEKVDSALLYYQKTYREMPTDTLYHVLGNVEYLFGNYYLDNNQVDKARPHIYRAKNFADKTVNLNTKDLVSGVLARLYMKDKKYGLAVVEYRKVLHQDMSMDRENLASMRKGMAEAYSHLQMWDSAYHYLQAYSLLNDSLQAEAADKNFAEVEAKYQNVAKNQEIRLLNEKNARSELKNTSLLIGSFLLLLLGGLGMVMLSNRSKIKRLEENQRLRNKIAADLHDEVGSTVSSILLIADMAQVQEKDEGKKRLFTKILNDSKHIAESMDEIIWAVNPGNDAVQGIFDKIKEYALPLAETQGIHLHFKAAPLLETEALPMHHRRNLYLIIKEALNNSLKYSRAKNIYVQVENGMKVTISDDGVGFDTLAKNGRNGIKNMRKRADEIGGELRIESAAGEGTEVVLTFTK